MSFQRISPSKERAVVNSIAEIIDVSRSRPGESLAKIAAEVFSTTEFTPELIRRACEAYNKSKSVYMLNKLSADSRAESFPLLDSAEVLQALYHSKEAVEEPVEVPTEDFSELVDHSEPEKGLLQKVAGEKLPEYNMQILARDKARAEIHLSTSIQRLCSKCEMHKLAADEAIQRAGNLMKKLSNKKLRKVAHLIINRYGDDGMRLMKVFAAKLNKELPMEKTAAAVILPLSEPYATLVAVVDEARQYRNLSGVLSKTAQLTQALTETVRGGARGAQRILDPVMAFAKTPIYSEVTKEKKAPLYEEVFDPNLVNELRQIESTQAFIDVASDDFIKDYPIEDVTEAYNNIVNVLPELQEAKYQPWLRTLVKQQLIQGNIYDQATIEQYAALKSALAKSDLSAAQKEKVLREAIPERAAVAGVPETIATKALFPEEGGGPRAPLKFEKPEGGKPSTRVTETSPEVLATELGPSGELLKTKVTPAYERIKVTKEID